jgi:hypothetical protein
MALRSDIPHRGRSGIVQIALCCVALAVAILLMLALSNHIDGIERKQR